MKKLFRKMVFGKSSAAFTFGLMDFKLGAILGLILVGLLGWAFYQAGSSSDILQFKTEILSIRSKISNSFSGSSGFRDLDNEIAIKLGAIPASYIKGDNIVNGWGGDITFSSSNDEATFFIETTEIPDEDCIALTSDQKDGWISIKINGTELDDNLSLVQITELCTSSDNTITFESR